MVTRPAAPGACGLRPACAAGADKERPRTSQPWQSYRMVGAFPSISGGHTRCPNRQKRRIAIDNTGIVWHACGEKFPAIVGGDIVAYALAYLSDTRDPADMIDRRLSNPFSEVLCGACAAWEGWCGYYADLRIVSAPVCDWDAERESCRRCGVLFADSLGGEIAEDGVVKFRGEG